MSVVKTLFTLIIGAAMGFAAMLWLPPAWMPALTSVATPTDDEPKPLYWVAPMDPNYRRDGPGKSPMGMDLVPVYAEDEGGSSSPGTVRISPEIVNNLGVRTAQVKQAHLQPEIRTVGYLRYNEDAIVHIHPRVEGWIEESFVGSTGDPVAKGQKLYSLYAPDLVNAQEELLFGIKRKNPTMASAAESRLKALQFSDESIRRLKRTGKVSQTVTFYAPVSGVVENLNLREGLYVKPGTTLLSISNLDQIWLDAEVMERQADLVKIGLPVEIELVYLPGQPINGTIDYIYPTLDSKTRTLRVRIRLENPDHTLKPNMFATLRILVRDDEQRLQVPQEAVIRGGSQDRVVLALGEGRFKSVEIETGRYDTHSVEVLSGVKEGDQVVTSAQFLIDSESSKSSDFVRIDNTEQEKAAKPTQVWTEITVNQIDPQLGKINVDHAAIDAWSWPEMTMDFELDPTLDTSGLSVGVYAHAQITRTEDKRFLISGLHIPDQPAPQADQSVPAERSASQDKVWVKATLLEVDTDALIINAQHEAIPEWQWPAMTMDFDISSWMDSSELPLNQPLFLEITRNESGYYEVTDSYLADDAQGAKP